MSIIQRISAGDYDTVTNDDIDERPTLAASFYRRETLPTNDARDARGLIVWRKNWTPCDDEECADCSEHGSGDHWTDREILVGATPAAVVAVLRSLDLEFLDADGRRDFGTATHPDGSTCIDYATGEREQLSASIFGYSQDTSEVIVDFVNDWNKASLTQ